MYLSGLHLQFHYLVFIFCLFNILFHGYFFEFNLGGGMSLFSLRGSASECVILVEIE